MNQDRGARTTKLRQSILALGATATLCAPVLAQVTLEPKLIKGSRTILSSTGISVKVTKDGESTAMAASLKATVTVSIGKRDAEGEVRVEERIDASRVSLKEPDSAESTEHEEQEREMAKKYLGVVTTTIFRNNSVVSVEIAPPHPEPIIQQEVVEAAKEAAKKEVEWVPSKPISKGDAWTRESKTRLWPGQVLTIVTRYVYEGEIEKDGRRLDRVSSSVVSAVYSLEALGVFGKPTNFVASSELKPSESTGEILFDRAQGIAIEMSSSMRITGNVLFTGHDAPTTFDFKFESARTPKP